MKHSLITLILFLNSSILLAQDLEKQWNNIKESIYLKDDSLNLIHKEVSKKYEACTDFALRKDFEERLQVLKKEIELNLIDGHNLEFAFVRNHLASPISLEVLNLKLHRLEGPKYYDTLYSLFKTLSNNENSRCSCSFKRKSSFALYLN